MNTCYYHMCQNQCKGKFCSSSCRGKHYMEIKYPLSKRKKCLTCGSLIKSTRKYCSRECMKKKPVTQKNYISYADLKQFCLEYKGSKCSKCGYSKCKSALCFHHVDSTTKKYTISSLCARHSISNDLLEELDKCILLCANCHAEEHHCM